MTSRSDQQQQQRNAACDCHLHEQQVCDICQGVDPDNQPRDVEPTAAYIVAEGDVPKVAPTIRYFTELRASLKNALDAERDVEAILHSWQQTCDASERENAAWRGWSEDVSRLLHAIDNDLSVSTDGKVYPQHVYARMLASRLVEIRNRVRE